MKRLILCLFAVVGLVGCSSIGTVQTETDMDRVAAIERAASVSGVQVIWVNKPIKVLRSGS
jgi:hypothetical protein